MTGQGGTVSGGCQCGAVRYRFSRSPRAPMICHCRMCQKAVGGPFAAFVAAPRSEFALTRGEMALFKSSDEVERGFCRDCGTPLTFDRIDSEWICISLGSLDDSRAFAPQKQFGVESRHDWVLHIQEMATQPPTEERLGELASSIRGSNRQHPDYDTDHWP